MTVIVCLEDRGGMLFNRRRLSRDRVLTANAVELARAEGKRLSMCGFSEKLFEEYSSLIDVDESFLDSGAEICFVENKALAPYLQLIDRLVIKVKCAEQLTQSNDVYFAKLIHSTHSAGRHLWHWICFFNICNN